MVRRRNRTLMRIQMRTWALSLGVRVERQTTAQQSRARVHERKLMEAAMKVVLTQLSLRQRQMQIKILQKRTCKPSSPRRTWKWVQRQNQRWREERRSQMVQQQAPISKGQTQRRCWQMGLNQEVTP